MQKLTYKAFALITITFLLVAGCATPISDTEKSAIKKIGIINSFEKHPNYLKIGTTMFTNKESLIEELEYKEFVRDEVANYLQNKGYIIVDVGDSDAISQGAVDMTIEIVPRDAKQRPYTYGYGFVQRFLLGKGEPPKSYIALNLVPKSNKARNPFSAYYHENYELLNIKTLPDTWNELTETQKNEFSNNLKLNISKTIGELIPKLGL